MHQERIGSIVFITGKKGGRYPFCNSILIDDERKGLIDPGSDEGFLRSLTGGTSIDYLINSHYHEDHTSYNFLFPESKLCVPEQEIPAFISIKKYLDFYGLLGEKFEDDWRQVAITRFNYRERRPEKALSDGDRIDFGKTKLEVVHTPGHTIGHLSFHFPEQGILFLGDLDMTRFGPWYGDRVSDIDQTIKSVERLLKLEADIYLTSHESGIIRGNISVLAEAYIDVISQREKKLMKFLEKPRTIHEIVGEGLVYGKGKSPAWFFEFGERGLMLRHLERLIRNNRVELAGGKYQLI